MSNLQLYISLCAFVIAAALEFLPFGRLRQGSAIVYTVAGTLNEVRRYEKSTGLSFDRLCYFACWTLPGPFTLLPYKPLLCYFFGERFPYAIGHFLKGHQNHANLIFHLVTNSVMGVFLTLVIC